MEHYLLKIQNSVENILIDGLNKKFDINSLKDTSKYTIENPRVEYERAKIREDTLERLREEQATKKAIKLKNLEKARAAKQKKQLSSENSNVFHQSGEKLKDVFFNSTTHEKLDVNQKDRNERVLTKPLWIIGIIVMVILLFKFCSSI